MRSKVSKTVSGLNGQPQCGVYADLPVSPTFRLLHWPRRARSSVSRLRGSATWPYLQCYCIGLCRILVWLAAASSVREYLLHQWQDFLQRKRDVVDVREKRESPSSWASKRNRHRCQRDQEGHCQAVMANYHTFGEALPVPPVEGSQQRVWWWPKGFDSAPSWGKAPLTKIKKCHKMAEMWRLCTI